MTNAVRWFCVVAVLLLCPAVKGQGKLQHQLHISSNSRYLVDEKNKPFFWLGDTGWLLFGKLTRDEAEKYLEDRRQKGFNVIQVMVLHNVAAANAYGDSALINKNVSTPDTTAGNSSSDPEQYDYWDHVDYIINMAAQKGLYMALVPVWGTNVKSGSVSKNDAERYAVFLARRFKNNWNIIWLNGGDIRGSDSTETWKTIGHTIKSIDANHLMTFHPFGRTTSSTWFHNESWLDFNMFQSGHRSYEQDTATAEHKFGPDNYKFVEIDYNKLPVKPTLDGEPSYEHIPYGLHDTTQPRWTADDIRRYAYWEVFAGGAGFTYGHNSVMQMHKPGDISPAYGSKKFWNDAINDTGAKQMVYLKRLMLSRSYFNRVPDQTIISNGESRRYDYIVATRGNDYAFLYTYNGRNFTVNMAKFNTGKVKAYWFNPRDGNTQFVRTIKRADFVEFDPPGEKKDGNDWVLILQKA